MSEEPLHSARTFAAMRPTRALRARSWCNVECLSTIPSTTLQTPSQEQRGARLGLQSRQKVPETLWVPRWGRCPSQGPHGGQRGKRAFSADQHGQHAFPSSIPASVDKDLQVYLAQKKMPPPMTTVGPWARPAVGSKRNAFSRERSALVTVNRTCPAPMLPLGVSSAVIRVLHRVLLSALLGYLAYEKMQSPTHKNLP